MDQVPELEHYASAQGPSRAPRLSLEHATSLHGASETAVSQAVVLTSHSAEHSPTSPTPVPIFTAPILSANSGGTYAPLVSDEGPSSLPALGLDGNPPRSTQRRPVPQTSLVFEDGDPRQRVLPLPPLPPEVRVRSSRIGLEGPLASGPRSGIDYIVPVNGKVCMRLVF